MTIEVFEGRLHWRRLSAPQREEIGSLALELVAAWAAIERCDENHDALDGEILAIMEPDGDMPLIDALRQAFVDAIPREALEAPDGQPTVPRELYDIHCASTGRG